MLFDARHDRELRAGARAAEYHMLEQRYEKFRNIAQFYTEGS